MISFKDIMSADEKSPCYKIKGKVEDLVDVFSSRLDNDKEKAEFSRRIKGNDRESISHLWEAFLVKVLSDTTEIKKVGCCQGRKSSHDVEIEFQNKKMLVEAVCPEEGDRHCFKLPCQEINEINEDREIDFISSTDDDIDTVLLRLTNAIRGKTYQKSGELIPKVEKALDDGIPYLIAICGELIEYLSLDDIREVDNRLIVKATFGVYSSFVVLDKERNAKLCVKSRQNIEKESKDGTKKPVSVSLFREGNKEYESVSGVLFLGSLFRALEEEQIIKNLLLIKNPNARNPIPDGFKVGKEVVSNGRQLSMERN